jgi:hypothetical protein
VRAPVLNDEEAGDLLLDGGSDQDGSRLGRGLNSRGNIGRVPEWLAGSVDDDGAALEPDAGDQLRRASAGGLPQRYYRLGSATEVTIWVDGCLIERLLVILYTTTV